MTILGGITLEVSTDLTKLPQKVASAMSAIEKPELVGANYKPLMYIGWQNVRGTNYWFIAKQTLMTRNLDEHIVTIAVNEYDGEYEIVKSSIVAIL